MGAWKRTNKYKAKLNLARPVLCCKPIARIHYTAACRKCAAAMTIYNLISFIHFFLHNKFLFFSFVLRKMRNLNVKKIHLLKQVYFYELKE